MLNEERENLIKSLKRNIISFPEGNVDLDYRKKDIEKILPHRPPIALIDRITRLNLKDQLIQAETTIAGDDPAFAGHFPGRPVYPGIFQIEMMGQAGLCLIYFLKNHTTVVVETNQPVKGLFTRVHNAGFNKGVKPGDHLLVRAKIIADDDYMGLMCAQIIMDNQVYAHSILEVYYP